MDRRRSTLLIPEIYEATVNVGHWDYVLELLTKVTRSKSACLYYLDKQLGIANTVAQYGCPEDAIREYNNQFAKLDILFDKAVDSSEKNESMCELFSPQSNEFINLESDIYKKWMMPQGIYYVGRMQFLDDHAHKASIAILRDEGAGPWRKGDIRVLDEVVPHFKRALNIHAEFTRLRLKQDALAKGLDRLVVGLILYDRHARIVYINPMAKTIIESHPALEFNNDALHLSNSVENKNLREKILATAIVDPDDSWKQSISVGITHPDVVAPLPLLITPMHAHLLTADMEHDSARVALFLSDPNLEQPISVDNLVSVYHLTPSEAKVAISLANGHSIEQIAKSSCHSTHTIRSQLKSTFKKTGVSRQSELIKLLLTGPFAHRRNSRAS